MKTKNIFFSSLFLIAAYSCSLENETYDQLGSDNVMTTENDVKAAVTGYTTNYVAEAGISIIVHGVLY